jgi:ABC-type branched-subunit amino acid transport system substrate-binding protein
MNKLIAEGVQAVIVSTTGVSRAILPAAEKNGVIIFTQCMDPTITSESKYSFRIFPSYLEEQKLTVNYLANNNYKNVCLLFLNSAGIKPEADAFKSFCQSYGVSVSSEETFESNQTDFRDVLAKIKRKNPDGLLILGYGQNYPPILTQARESGIKCKIFGNVALEQEGATRFGTEIYEGVIFPSFSVAQNNSKIDSLKNRYYQRYGKYPGGFLDYPYFYDAFMILSEVLKKTSGDKEKAIEMLNGGSFQVVGLNLKFNKEGDIYPPLAIGMYSGGKVVQIKE